MTGQIRITPEAMRGRAWEFRAARENFLNVVQSMSNLIGTLREEWEGQASEKFAEQFEALRPSFNEMGELIESIAKQCDGVADATQALDEEMAAKFIS